MSGRWSNRPFSGLAQVTVQRSLLSQIASRQRQGSNCLFDVFMTVVHLPPTPVTRSKEIWYERKEEKSSYATFQDQSLCLHNAALSADFREHIPTVCGPGLYSGNVFLLTVPLQPSCCRLSRREHVAIPPMLPAGSK